LEGKKKRNWEVFVLEYGREKLMPGIDG